MRAARPPLVRRILLRVGMRPGDVGDQQPGAVQPALDVPEVVRDRRGDGRVLGEQLEDPPARVVHVVRRTRAGRISADHDVDANGFGASHEYLQIDYPCQARFPYRSIETTSSIGRRVVGPYFPIDRPTGMTQQDVVIQGTANPPSARERSAWFAPTSTSTSTLPNTTKAAKQQGRRCAQTMPSSSRAASDIMSGVQGGSQTRSS
jgi:hypothetical protein